MYSPHPVRAPHDLLHLKDGGGGGELRAWYLVNVPIGGKELLCSYAHFDNVARTLCTLQSQKKCGMARRAGTRISDTNTDSNKSQTDPLPAGKLPKTQALTRLKLRRPLLRWQAGRFSACLSV